MRITGKVSSSNAVVPSSETTRKCHNDVNKWEKAQNSTAHCSKSILRKSERRTVVLLGSLGIILPNALCISLQERLRCSKEFCSNVVCEPLAECSKGRIVPNATYCGCCSACVITLGENEKCVEPVPGSLRDIKVPECKAGLKCIQGKCSPVTDSIPPCLLLRKTIKSKSGEENYADNLWIPECDEDGTFKATQRKKQKVLCYDKQGNKIFGQAAPHTKSMTCGCSRYLENLKIKNLLTFNIHRQEHCSAIGNFDQIQCIKDICYCAHPVTGQVEGRVVKSHYISKLPCYKKEIHGKDIQKACEKELQRIQSLLYFFHLKGVEISGLEKLQCDLDGTFSSRQCDTKRCVCTDKKGVGIESYFIGAEDYDKLGQVGIKMTCNCARDVGSASWQSQYPILKCKGYGNYSPLQCFDNEECFCVDTDGEVISEYLNKTEVDETFCNNMLHNLILPSETSTNNIQY
ncbi:uncharacterized protein CDAR_287971 [Caerostris darwini]|uniref:Thyroglobulin type-1 domain-containing protein n=1 Tax=Caerostris darwini TaxID=1538125 RepID=A0AAV4P801_9ARAC|nr:uncharacterized protein CDAR_287971 [Caerostris darwini]